MYLMQGTNTITFTCFLLLIPFSSCHHTFSLLCFCFYQSQIHPLFPSEYSLPLPSPEIYNLSSRFARHVRMSYFLGCRSSIRYTRSWPVVPPTSTLASTAFSLSLKPITHLFLPRRGILDHASSLLTSLLSQKRRRQDMGLSWTFFAQDKPHVRFSLLLFRETAGGKR